MRTSGKRVCLVFNKVDKVSKGSVKKKIGGHLGHLPVDDTTAVVIVRSVN